MLVDEGYLKVTPYSFIKKKAESGNGASGDDSTENEKCDAAFFEELKKLRKGSQLPINSLTIKEGETNASEEIHVGFNDSCNGECGTAYRG